MSIYKLQCPSVPCAKWFRVPESALGRPVRCPHCHHPTRVPGDLAELNPLKDAACFTIRIERGPAFAGRETALDPGRTYTFGKSDTCEVQLPGPSVSRRHFSLHHINGKWVLEDLNSTNGVEVNGLPTIKTQLDGGENITVGAYLLEFRAPARRPVVVGSGSEPLVEAPADASPYDVGATHGAGSADDPRLRRLLHEATGYTAFTTEHRDQQVIDSTRRYTLSLASRLLLTSAALALVVGGSIYWAAQRRHAPTTPAVVPATPDPDMPTEFSAALAAGDWRRARDLVSAAAADPSQTRLAQLMQVRLDERIGQSNAELLSLAWTAVRAENWREVEALIRKAGDPIHGAVSGDWQPIRDQFAEVHAVEKAAALRGAGDLVQACAVLRDARRSYPDGVRAAALLRDLEQQIGAGLVVRVKGDAAGAAIVVNNEPLGPAGREVWGLAPGSAQVSVRAPGCFVRDESVRLTIGELTTLEVDLRPLAPRAVWALAALEGAKAPEALWLAAQHYRDVNAIPEGLHRLIVDVTRDAAELRPARGAPRVVEIELRGGDKVIARIWSETDDVLNVQLLPGGETRILPREEIAVAREHGISEALVVLRGSIEAILARTGDSLDALRRLAKLRVELGDDASFRTVCDALVGRCLEPLEVACAGCAGTRAQVCPACQGAGKEVVFSPCTNCKGAGKSECPTCNGTGDVRCGKCNGSGTQTRTVRSGGQTTRRTENCEACRGATRKACVACNSGKRTCPKCDGRQVLEKKANCRWCEKGRVPCAACEGRGARADMLSDARTAAELYAAELVKRAR